MTKKIPPSGIIGQQGINLIEQVVLQMGFLWYPTGGLEAGIDGLIEIRNSATDEVTNSVIQVQSKATAGTFTAETATTFEFLCDAADLDYWLRGNAPVILVISRPTTREAYWVSLKAYFRDPATRQSRKVRFDKQLNRFEMSSKAALLATAVPRDSGIYFAPPPKAERLYSNLLSVLSFAPHIYVGDTEYRDPREVIFEFQRLGVHPPQEWLLYNKRLISFHNLRGAPWPRFCDQGTVEEFGTEEWSQSDDSDRCRQFVQLLNHCLREKAWKLDLRYFRDGECFYFRPAADLSPRVLVYQSLAKTTSRFVFKAYPSKTVPGKIAYYRHSALRGQFRRYGNQWYLEITPTYHFTWDGFRPDKYYQDRLKGIKRLERNGAVVGQLVMWAWYLSQSGDIFSPPYPYLAFGQLAYFTINAGIDDAAWLGHEEEEERAAIESSLDELPLLQDED
jgi:uncharacterized protein DUF4365